MNKFEQIGYFKEYYQNGKFIGCITNVEKDREQIGYYGKKSETLESDLIVNKKKLKKGSIVETMLYPLCGKNINN
jgi:hypothetical protein